MGLAILIAALLFYLHLGWCWADALVRFEAKQPQVVRHYTLSFLLWPFSMMLWDARQQEDDYDDQY